MSQIYKIEPSYVVHELILKPLGTYLIRVATENDDILSQIKNPLEIKTNPYVVLSVRVDENKYYCPIMNYRLPFIESNNEENLKYLLEYYKNNSKMISLPDLIEECNIKTDDTKWEIDRRFFDTQYTHLYGTYDNGIKADMKCNIQDRIKVFKKLMINNEQEFLILQNLSYFHIVTFYGICYETDKIKYLIFADNGESLKRKYLDGLMIKQLYMIGYQIACGMIYLESKHVIHRDLHAGNILIDEHNFIRIADFEHAIIKDDDENNFQQTIKNSKLEFQTRRLAPECLPWPPEDGEMVDSIETLLNEFSSKSDVWAYGLIFIDLTIDADEHIYPDLPIKSDDEETSQLVQYVKLDRKIHRRPYNCPKNLYNVLKRCWEYSRDDRISFMDIRNEMLRLFKSSNE